MDQKKLVERYDTLSNLIGDIDKRLAAIDTCGVQTASIPKRHADRILPIPWHKYFVSEVADGISAVTKPSSEVVAESSQTNPSDRSNKVFIDEAAALLINPLQRMKRLASAVASLAKDNLSTTHARKHVVKQRLLKRSRHILDLVIRDEGSSAETELPILSLFSLIPGTKLSPSITRSRLKLNRRDSNTVANSTEPKSNNDDDSPTILPMVASSDPKSLWARCCKDILLFSTVIKETVVCVAAEVADRELSSLSITGDSHMSQVLKSIHSASPVLPDALAKVVTGYTQHALQRHHALLRKLALRSEVPPLPDKSSAQEGSAQEICRPCNGLLYRLPLPLVRLGLRLVYREKGEFTSAVVAAPNSTMTHKIKSALVSKVSIKSATPTSLHPTQSLIALSPSLLPATTSSGVDFLSLLWGALQDSQEGYHVLSSSSITATKQHINQATITRQHNKLLSLVSGFLHSYFTGGGKQHFNYHCWASALHHLFTAVGSQPTALYACETSAIPSLSFHEKFSLVGQGPHLDSIVARLSSSGKPSLSQSFLTALAEGLGLKISPPSVLPPASLTFIQGGPGLKWVNGSRVSISDVESIMTEGMAPMKADLQEYLRAKREAGQQARLRALKSSDAEAYMAHLSDVKVSSLLKIMETTHKFMLKVGAQISVKGAEEEKASAGSAAARKDGTVVDTVLKQHSSVRGGVAPNPSITADSSGDAEYQKFKDYVRSTNDEYKLVHKVETFVEAQPLGLQATLMPHQVIGLRFLVSLHANGINGILADEMGVGKTIQTISFLLHLKEERQQKAGVAPVRADTTEESPLPSNNAAPAIHGSRYQSIPNLVLAPLSIIREWRDACAQFVPNSIKVCELHELEQDTEDDEAVGSDEDETIAAVMAKTAKVSRRKHSSSDSSEDSSSESSSSESSDGSDDSDDSEAGPKNKKKNINFSKYYDQRKSKQAKAQRKRERGQAVKQRGPSAANPVPKRITKPGKAARTPWERAMDYDIVLLALHRTKDMSKELRSQVPWGYIVVDEAHKAVSNLSTITAQAISAINFKRRLVLTGTPLNNDLQELWSLLHFINPEIFSAQDSFEEVFRRPFQATSSSSKSSSAAKAQLNGSALEGKSPQEIQEARHRAQEEQQFQRQLAQDVQLKEEEKQLLIMRMHQILRPFMLRRTKKDIDTSLKITFHEVKCPLTVIQRGLLAVLREHKVLPHMISEPKRGFIERHYSNADGGEARAALIRSDIALYRGPAKPPTEVNTVNSVQGNTTRKSKATKRPSEISKTSAAVNPINHTLLLNPCTGYVDDSATDSDTDIEELPKSVAAQRLLAASRPVKRFPHNLIVYSACQLRAVTTVTTTAQTICNHPFMIPFFSRVLMRETERQIARVINVYRKIRKVAESERLNKFEIERKRALAAEKRRQTILLKKKLAEDQAATLKPSEDNTSTVADQAIQATDDPIKVVDASEQAVSLPTPPTTTPPPPHPFLTQKEDENKIRMLVTCLMEGKPVPTALENDPLVRSVIIKANEQSDDEDKPTRGGRRLESTKGSRKRAASDSENEIHSASKADDPRRHPISYPFEAFNIAALRSAEVTLSCSGKFIVLDMILRRLKLLNKKVVIFSHWLDCIDLLSEYLDGCGWRGQHVALTGSASADERKEAVDQFRTDPNMLVFIVSVKAGGCGLNLQVANIVIMLDRDYTATNEDQAIARVFRIGQRNTVRAISLCTADAAEARILAISDKKNKPREALIEGGGYNIGTTDSDRQRAVSKSLKAKRHINDAEEEEDDNPVSEESELEEKSDVVQARDDAFIDLTELEVLSPMPDALHSTTPTHEVFDSISFRPVKGPKQQSSACADMLRLHQLSHAFDHILVAESDFLQTSANNNGDDASSSCPALDTLGQSGITYKPLFQQFDWSLSAQSTLNQVPAIITKSFVECSASLELASTSSGRASRRNNAPNNSSSASTSKSETPLDKVVKSSWITALLASSVMPTRPVPIQLQTDHQAVPSFIESKITEQPVPTNKLSTSSPAKTFLNSCMTNGSDGTVKVATLRKEIEAFASPPSISNFSQSSSWPSGPLSSSGISNFSSSSPYNTLDLSAISLTYE